MSPPRSGGESPALFEGDKPLAARLELVESSGPVSPAHQYFVKLQLIAGPAGLKLRRDLKRDWKDGSFQTCIDDEVTVDRAVYEQLWADLLAAGAFSPTPQAPAREATKARVGVSHNHLTLQLGSQKTRVEFRTSDLARETPPPWLPLLQRVRQLADL